ncbi:MAG: transcription termination/antitermination protein NusG [Fusobacterium necrophorum]|nr:transcription termination/antitermination protein NusG [Fusobacterium necrophorum]
MTKTEVKRWFMIHTYSGYEKKVKTDLEQKIETLGMKEIVSKILVPEERSTEIVRGKEKVVFRKIFPGYVMLEMTAVREESDEGINYKVDSDAWYVVRNTNGVTGFVGVGSDPIPMEEHEVENIFRVIGYEQEVREFHKADFQVGHYVKVLEGAFVNKEGKVAEMDYEQGKVKIMIDIFGRMTPVEVSFSSVEKM